MFNGLVGFSRCFLGCSFGVCGKKVFLAIPCCVKWAEGLHEFCFQGLILVDSKKVVCTCIATVLVFVFIGVVGPVKVLGLVIVLSFFWWLLEWLIRFTFLVSPLNCSLH